MTQPTLLEEREEEHPVSNVTSLCRLPACAGSCGGVYEPPQERQIPLFARVVDDAEWDG